MRKLITIVAAVFALAGCVAVPYEPGPAVYYGPHYSPYYVAPPVSFSYRYLGGHRHHHHHP